MEDYVTYEQALQLKELGFDWECNGIYKYHSSKIIHKLPKNPHKKKSIKKAIENYPIITFLKKNTEIEYRDDSWINSYYLDEHKYVNAPTLAQAQKWLREVKNIIVLSTCNLDYEKGHSWFWFVDADCWIDNPEHNYSTYETAFLAGIDKALELLKQ